MSRIHLPLFLLLIIAFVVPTASAGEDESRYHEFPRTTLTIEDFRASGYVLDIGGGGEEVIGVMKSSQVVAIDISERELVEAPDGPLKIVMDATDLKFLDGTFATATSFFTLMYMDEETQEKTFREVSRALISKGRFLVWDVQIPTRKHGQKEIAVFPFTFTLPGGHVINTGYGVRWPGKIHDLAYYQALAERTGFRVVRKEDHSQTFFLELESTARAE